MKADVCIVGSGFAGTLAARKVAAGGRRIVLLEAGTEGAPSAESASTFSCTNHSETIPGYSPMTVFKLVGGHSGLWGGASLRFPRGLFEGRGPGGPTMSWPIPYGEVSTYYDEAEKILLGDEEPPTELAQEIRGSEYLERFSAAVAKAGGLQPFRTRHSRLRLADSVLPELGRAGRVELIRGVTATAVDMQSRTLARGVTFQRADGSRDSVEARSVILACGAIETPRLLLLSRSAFHPDGIGNEHGQVGRHLCDHFQVIPELLCLGAPLTGDGISAFRWTRHWKHPELDVPYFVFGTGVRASVTARDVILSERAWGHRLDRLLRERVGTHAELRILAAMRSQAENRIDLDPTHVDATGTAMARVRLRPSSEDHAALDGIEAWVRRIYSGFDLRGLRFGTGPQGGPLLSGGHLTGTCRMGTDPKESVVDPDLRVHGVENLFVSGGATFVTSGAQNPTLTIVALTLRLGDHLSRWLRERQVRGV